MMKILLETVVLYVIQGGRGVPRPRPLGKLTAPRARPLSDELASDGQSGLVCGVAFGVTLGVVPGVLRSSSGMSDGSP